MTDLDRRIAALKGLEIVDLPGTGPAIKIPTGWTVPPAWWSGDEVKAWELVDELVGKDNAGAPFEMLTYSQTPNSQWLARFYIGRSQWQNYHTGLGSTRPEAICRAWIASKEYLLRMANAEKERKLIMGLGISGAIEAGQEPPKPEGA